MGDLFFRDSFATVSTDPEPRVRAISLKAGRFASTQCCRASKAQLASTTTVIASSPIRSYIILMCSVRASRSSNERDADAKPSSVMATARSAGAGRIDLRRAGDCLARGRGSGFLYVNLRSGESGYFAPHTSKSQLMMKRNPALPHAEGDVPQNLELVWSIARKTD